MENWLKLIISHCLAAYGDCESECSCLRSFGTFLSIEIVIDDASAV